MKLVKQRRTVVSLRLQGTPCGPFSQVPASPCRPRRSNEHLGAGRSRTLNWPTEAKSHLISHFHEGAMLSDQPVPISPLQDIRWGQLPLPSEGNEAQVPGVQSSWPVGQRPSPRSALPAMMLAWQSTSQSYMCLWSSDWPREEKDEFEHLGNKFHH